MTTLLSINVLNVSIMTKHTSILLAAVFIVVLESAMNASQHVALLLTFRNANAPTNVTIRLILRRHQCK